MSDATSEKRMVLEKPVGLYDGACKFCVSTTNQLREMDRHGVIDWQDLHDPAVRARFPKLDWKLAEEEIHLIHRDGRVVTGVRALHDIAELIGGELGGAAAKVMELPGVREAADALYHLISQHRYEIFGDKGKKE